MIGIALGAFSWFRSTWIGKAAAIALGVLIAVFMIYRKGRSDAMAKQREANMEEYIDARKRADDAADRAREVGNLSDDELDERLRKRGAIRDDGGV